MGAAAGGGAAAAGGGASSPAAASAAAAALEHGEGGGGATGGRLDARINAVLSTSASPRAIRGRHGGAAARGGVGCAAGGGSDADHSLADGDAADDAAVVVDSSAQSIVLANTRPVPPT